MHLMVLGGTEVHVNALLQSSLDLTWSIPQLRVNKHHNIT
jgi:hypothetical protein